jgi:hypothetical protein
VFNSPWASLIYVVIILIPDVFSDTRGVTFTTSKTLHNIKCALQLAPSTPILTIISIMSLPQNNVCFLSYLLDRPNYFVVFEDAQ